MLRPPRIVLLEPTISSSHSPVLRKSHRCAYRLHGLGMELGARRQGVCIMVGSVSKGEAFIGLRRYSQPSDYASLVVKKP